MPLKRHWTEAQDTQIKRLRAEGASWEAIGATLGMSRFTVMDRGRTIGAHRPPAEFTPPVEDPEREPLPPGHPRSWAAITHGSVLEGEPYPLPVFDR